MKRFLKLINFEFNRFYKFYFALIGVTIVMQITAVIIEARKFLIEAREFVYTQMMPESEFIEQYGTFTLYRVIHSGWFGWSVALCVVVLFIYIFFIWYRDWLGKSSFIYRLLMLPIPRIHLYFSKLLTILVLVFGLVAFQLLLLPVENQIIKWMVPADYRSDLAISEFTRFSYLAVLYPNSLLQFFMNYGIGVMAVSVVFTGILFERCFRLKGIFLAALYCLVSAGVFLAPLLIDTFLLDNYFFPMELFYIEFIAGIIVIGFAFWIANFLLKKKIRV